MNFICPYCKKDASYSSQYNIYICKNKSCSNYLKDEILSCNTDLEKQCQYILDNFDFDKVKKVMTFLNWKWQIRNVMVVPTIYEMKQSVRSLFNSLISEYKVKNENNIIASGGFKVSVYDGFLELDFILETEYYSED